MFNTLDLIVSIIHKKFMKKRSRRSILQNHISTANENEQRIRFLKISKGAIHLRHNGFR